MHEVVPLVSIPWPKQYRIIPSRFPAVNVFEKVVEEDQLELAFYLESLTNDRLRSDFEELSSMSNQDGTSIILAAFLHKGKPSRFSSGNYGVYYASRDLKTAIKETAYHREQFLKSTEEPPLQLDMRVYVGKVIKPLHDIRNPIYAEYHHKEEYKQAQAFSSFLRERGSFGIVYNSVRDTGGQCIAALRPTAVSIPNHSKHLVYVWNGECITTIYEKSQIRNLVCI